MGEIPGRDKDSGRGPPMSTHWNKAGDKAVNEEDCHDCDRYWTTMVGHDGLTSETDKEKEEK